ncbi:MAG TPA: hypothetical protein DCQ76_00755 [Ruminococcaceae bacterium]|nr:hypothetical protein [Oscillospiraceae bacterium]
MQFAKMKVTRLRLSVLRKYKKYFISDFDFFQVNFPLFFNIYAEKADCNNTLFDFCDFYII